MKKNFLMPIAISFALGILLGNLSFVSIVSEQSFIYWIALSLIGIFITIGALKNLWLKNIFLYLFCLILGIGSISIRNISDSTTHTHKKQWYRIEVDTPIDSSRYYYKCVARCKPIYHQEETTYYKVLLNISKQSQINFTDTQMGTVALLLGKEVPFVFHGNPGEFNQPLYWKSKRVRSQIFVRSKSDILFTKYRNESLKHKSLKIQYWLSDCIRNSDLSSNSSSVLCSILLGNKKHLSYNIKQDFTQSGTAHLLAISGLHVGILVLIIHFILKKVFRNKALKIFLMFLFLLIYSFITGLSASVLRASLMFLSFSIVSNLERKANSYNILSLVAIILLALDPFWLFDIGFQLSFSAVFSILFYTPYIQKVLHSRYLFIKYICSLISVSIAVQPGVLPIVLYYFHQQSSYFIIGNLLGIPLLTVIFTLGIASLFILHIPLIGVAVTKVLDALITLLLWYNAKIADLPYNTLSFPYFNLKSVIFYVVALSTFIIYLKWKTPFRFVSLWIVFISLFLLYKQNRATDHIILYNSTHGPVAQVNYSDSAFVFYSRNRKYAEKLYLQGTRRYGKSHYIKYVYLGNKEQSIFSKKLIYHKSLIQTPYISILCTPKYKHYWSANSDVEYFLYAKDSLIFKSFRNLENVNVYLFNKNKSHIMNKNNTYLSMEESAISIRPK